jgi:hypothetical protein
MPAARPTLHTVKELSLATLWLLQHEQYYHVGYALLEYVTHVAIERLPPEERAAMYRHMEEKSAGLKSQVQTATLLNVLAAASASASSSSGGGGLFGSLLPLVFSSAPKAPDASLMSMVEEAMLHMMPAARPEDTTTLLRMVAHGKEGLLAYLNRSDRSAASTQKDAAAPSASARAAAAAGRV